MPQHDEQPLFTFDALEINPDTAEGVPTLEIDTIIAEGLPAVDIIPFMADDDIPDLTSSLSDSTGGTLSSDTGSPALSEASTPPDVSEESLLSISDTRSSSVSLVSSLEIHHEDGDFTTLHIPIQHGDLQAAQSFHNLLVHALEGLTTNGTPDSPTN